MKHIWVCGRSEGEREGGRRSGPTEILSHLVLGLGSAVKQCRMGLGKAWNTNVQPYCSPRTMCREGGGGQELQGRTVPKATRGPIHQWQVWWSFEFPLICRTFGLLFSIKKQWAVLAVSRTLPLRLPFCTAHWADLEGQRNWVWKLQHSGGLAVWQNLLTREMHVMSFPLLFSSAQASVSTSLCIIWKEHMEEVRF